MEKLLQDLRFGLRLLFKNPAVTAVVVLSLGLGIGVNATIFSLFNAVLLRPLPRVEQPDRMVELYTSYQNGLRYGSVSYPDYLDMRDRNQVFSSLLAQRLILTSLNNSGQNEIIPAAIVSGNYFSLLGVTAAQGRTFVPEEDQSPGAHSVAVISYRLWQRRFGADPNLPGKTISLNNRNFTIVGVAPEGFVGANIGLAPDIWIPLMMQADLYPGRPDRLKERGTRWLDVIGRLKPGVSLEQARAAMNPLVAQLSQENPATNKGTSLTIVRSGHGAVGIQSTLTPVLTLLLAVVILVLLIACFNIANLLIARATARRREIGIRLAMGATRGRIIRQLLTESVLLSVLGGMLGLLLAYWTSNLLLAFKPPTSLPLFLDLHLDGRVLTFTALISVVTGLVFGLAPAIQTSSPALLPALKDQSSSPGYRKSRLRNILVIAQVAISLVLLIAAGLFIRSLQSAHSVNPGFRAHNLLIASMDVSLARYDESKGARFYEQLIQHVELLPGVQSVTLGKLVPLELGANQQIGVAIEGYETPQNENLSLDYNVVSQNYFRTLDIPLMKGREFSGQDKIGTPGVVIVNETMAQKFWPKQDPLGKRLSITGRKGTYLEVIGVVKDSKYYSLREDPRAFMYLPFWQAYKPGMTLHVSTATDPEGLLGSVRHEIQSLDRDVPVYNVMTMTDHLDAALIELRLAAVLLGLFGLLALILAAVGLYGVMAYSVSRRKREIGIRMAVGAQRGDVLRLIVKQGMFLTMIGLLIGLGVSFALTRTLSTLLYGIKAVDLPTFIVVSLLLVGVSLIASLIPAQKAIRIDPMLALRHE